MGGEWRGEERGCRELKGKRERERECVFGVIRQEKRRKVWR